MDKTIHLVRYMHVLLHGGFHVFDAKVCGNSRKVFEELKTASRFDDFERGTKNK